MMLTVVFRRSGWQWPLGAHDTVRVYGADGALLAEVPGTLVCDLLSHAVRGATIQGRLTAHVTREVPMLPEPESPAPRPRLRQDGRRLRTRTPMRRFHPGLTE